MKNTNSLIKLANKFAKYASIDANELKTEIETKIWQALKNAASWNNGQVSPFEQMVLEDGITLSFDVTRNDTLTSKKITISNVEIAPVEKKYLITKYTPVIEEIKSYLEKNWELYPSQRFGEDISYHNFTIHLEYPGTQTFAKK